jgi:hypothetical protein
MRNMFRKLDISTYLYEKIVVVKNKKGIVTASTG